MTFELGAAQNMPYPHGSFDPSMDLLAIDHIPDARKATIEMRRVTKTAGVRAVRDPPGRPILTSLPGHAWDFDWQKALDADEVVPVVQVARKPAPDFPNVPLAVSLRRARRRAS